MWRENSQIIKERSGIVINNISGGWINIDNWMGIIAEPLGNFIYNSAKDYNRKGVAEGEILFKPDENKNPRFVIVLSRKNVEATSEIQGKMKWGITNKECKISFPLSNKELMEFVFPITTRI